MKLPIDKDTKVAIIFDMGSKQQSVEVIHQQY